MNSEAVMEAIRQREKCRIALHSAHTTFKEEHQKWVADHPLTAEIDRQYEEMRTHELVIDEMANMVRRFYHSKFPNGWIRHVSRTEAGIEIRVEDDQDRYDVSQYSVTVAWDEFWQEWVLSKLSE